ncbi:MAG: thioredoxin [Lentisphaerae bacterium]|nr:thioredoxin [Lentisphaerota bacterium]
MASKNIVHLNGGNWQTEVATSAQPILVDFWAEWCGPCKMIAPILDEVADQMAGKLKVGKVNVDENQDLAAQFHVRSIPTLLVFKGGVVQEQMIGALRKTELLAKLKAYA